MPPSEPQPATTVSAGNRLPVTDTAGFLGTLTEESKEGFYFAPSARDQPQQRVPPPHPPQEYQEGLYYFAPTARDQHQQRLNPSTAS